MVLVELGEVAGLAEALYAQAGDAGAAGAPIACLGVQSFGQSGDIAELYEHHQIDAESVVGAALDLLDA